MNVISHISTLLVAGLFAAGSAAGVAAQGLADVAPERVDEFIEVMAANNCRMSQTNAEEVIIGAGFEDRAEVQGIVSRLLFFGRARVEGETLIVFDGPCPQYNGPDLTKTLLEGLAAAGCEMSADRSSEFLQSTGIQLNELAGLLPVLEAWGYANRSDGGTTLTLTAETCEDFGGQA